ncbi:MAG: tyrosinase family protein [Alphaproteobacteria bacterium]|nr:tyrosinase family protein [Alphaproteobacteria bacterium]
MNSSPPPPSVRTRKNVSTLGHAGDDLFWYGRAVAELQSRPVTDPTSWRYLSAVHGYDRSSDPNPVNVPFPSSAQQEQFWNQCQHQSWFFEPWHRAYLVCFEQIVAAAVAKLGGPADWALPYWNYSAPGNNNAARLLPAAFVSPQLADHSRNPLWVAGRNSPTANFHIPDADVSLHALADPVFTGGSTGGHPGFGGPKTIFSHSGGTNGGIEDVPHNQIHDDIGGLMGDPDTAALDPIFWLHHANIDRLWEVWRHRNAGFVNPTDPDWLNKISFELHGAAGTVLTFKPSQVVDTTKLLHGYRYDDISDPLAAHVAAAAAAMTAGPQPQPELVGASAPIVLDSAASTAAVAFRPQAAQTARARTSALRPTRTFLNLENVTGTGRLPRYDVYIDVVTPAQASPAQTSPAQTLPPQPTGGGPGLFAGSLSTFGVQKATRPGGPHGGSGITTVLDITDLVEQLRREQRWDESGLQVTFVRRGQQSAPTSNLQVGRVSVYYG